MNQLNAFIAVAAAQIGYYVKPGRKTVFGEWYGLPTGQWCAMFVSWCADQVGILGIIPKHAYTPSGVNWFKARGQWHDGLAGVRRGDLVYFDFPGAPNRVSHIGIVESVNSDGSVNTIEGNTSGPSGDQRNGGACLRKRRKAYIVGYGRPNYDGDVTRDYLQKGDTGARVTELQSALIARGFDLGEHGADGVFGDATRKAVMDFQTGEGIEVDGIAGKDTLGRLGLKASSPVPTPPKDNRPRNVDGSLTIAQDGIRGPATIARWQEVMGTPIDGVISKPSALIAADQRFLNSVVAADHIRNLTGRPALVVDGIEGKFTVIVRQFWLRNAVSPGHQQNLIGHFLAFDAELGPETNLVHQFALNNATAGSGRYGQV